MEEEYKVLKSYSKVWRIERMFYEIGGVNLPFPVAFNALIYYIVFVFLIYVLRGVVIINKIPPLYKYLFIPGGLAYLFNSKLLDGKNPIGFLKSILIHYYVIFFKGSKVVRYKYIKARKEKAKYTNKISYRILEKTKNIKGLVKTI